jgi:endonuclease YncB( thermonuclease family)
MLLGPSPARAGEWSGVPLVIDAGTLAIDGQRLRLADIDTPEKAQTCRDAGQAAYDCGIEASRALAVIIAGRAVRCSGERRDFYRRPLVVCMIGDLDIGRELVRIGWALAPAAAPDDYAAAETEARDSGRGLWQGPFQRPGAWRRAHGMR